MYIDEGYKGLVGLHSALGVMLHDDKLCTPDVSTREGSRRADFNMCCADLPEDVRAEQEAASDAEIAAYGHRVEMARFYMKMLYTALTDVIDRDDWYVKTMEHYIKKESGLGREERVKLLRAVRSMHNKVRLCYGAPEQPEDDFPDTSGDVDDAVAVSESVGTDNVVEMAPPVWHQDWGHEPDDDGPFGD